MFSSLKDMVYLAALAHLSKPVFEIIISPLGYFMLGDVNKDKDFAVERFASRLKQGTERRDFILLILE
jgi:hypothetical protein